MVDARSLEARVKLTLEHGGRLLEVEVRADGDGHRVTLDGREQVVRARHVDDHTLLLEIDGRRQTVHLARVGALRYAAVGGETHRFALHAAGAAHGDMSALAEPEVRAPMPGKVLQVLVAAGDAVTSGDGLLILEAMKMENRLTASADGVVQEMRVAAGEMVTGGQVLAVLKFG